MSAYCSAEGFESRYGRQELLQLTDLDGDGQPDGGELDTAVADVAGEVDSYLGQRYPLPLPHVPDVLRARAHDMLRYRLYDHQPPEEVRRRYEDAVKWLQAVATGRASLGLPEGEDAPPEDSVAVVRSRPAVFTRDRMGRRP